LGRLNKSLRQLRLLRWEREGEQSGKPATARGRRRLPSKPNTIRTVVGASKTRLVDFQPMRNAFHLSVMIGGSGFARTAEEWTMSGSGTSGGMRNDSRVARGCVVLTMLGVLGCGRDDGEPGGDLTRAQAALQADGGTSCSVTITGGDVVCIDCKERIGGA